MEIGTAVEPTKVDSDSDVAEGNGSSSHLPYLGPSVDVPAAAEPPAQQARNHLLSLSKPHGGCVAAAWTVRGLLLVLQFAFDLKPGRSMQDCLANAVRLLFAVGAERLARALESGELPMPSLSLLRAARIRLDLCRILYERKCSECFFYIRHVMVDASPQLGSNYLCVREDRIRISMDIRHKVREQAQIDLNAAFETRIMPLSTLGHGRASALKKSVNVSSLYLMESEDFDAFDVTRNEVCSICTDQGAEKNISEAGVRILPEYRGAFAADDVQSFLWPVALPLPGHLHIFFNALESACKSVIFAATFFVDLRAITNFLSNKQLRRKFQACCMSGKAGRHEFNSFPRTHVDWRWEFLGPALTNVLRLLPYMVLHFDLQRMLAAETGQGESIFITEVARVLAIATIFTCRCRMFLVVAVVLEHYASKLEGCLCHSEIWQQLRSYRARAEQVFDSTGHLNCVWKGRNAPWLIAGGIEEILNAVGNAHSNEFDQLLASLSADDRSNVVGAFDQLRNNLVSNLQEKLEFWLHIPFRCLGVFWAIVGDDEELAKQVLRECLEEYEAALRGGSPNSLHRVSVKLLDGMGSIGRELRMWLLSDKPLNAFPYAFCGLLAYALCSVVERRVESIHAIIKQTASTYVLPPYVCATVRERANLELLRSEPAFMACAQENWRKASLLHRILKHRRSRDDLSNMTRTEKIKAVYQCDMVSEYADTSNARREQDHWALAVPALQDRTEILSPPIKCCLRYLKRLFEGEQLFSLPRGLFESWQAAGKTQSSAPLVGDPIDCALELVFSEPRNLWCSLDNLVWFRVVNAAPEKRTLVKITHDINSRSIIIVKPLLKIAAFPGRGEVLAQETSDLFSLNVTFLITDFRATLANLQRWVLGSYRSTVAAKPDRSLASICNEAPLMPTEIDGSVPCSAIVPSSSTSPVALAPVGTDGSAGVRALAQLHDLGGLSRHIDMTSLEFVSHDTLLELEAQGVVSTQRDEFGEMQIALRSGAVTFRSLHVLEQPFEAFRLFFAEAPNNLPTLYYLLRLCEEGFVRSAAELPPLIALGALKHDAALSRPRSYLAAMLARESIWSKGVLAIRHDMSDNYYRCLLTLTPELLAAMLTDMDNKNDEWFRQRLKNRETTDSEEEVEDGPAPEDNDGADGAPAQVDALVPPVVAEDVWQRCSIDTGADTPSFKVWFSNATDSNGERRCFTKCDTHDGCMNRRSTAGTRFEFCTAVYLWHQVGASGDIEHSTDHWAFWPSPQEVEDAMPGIRLTDF